MNHFKKYLVFSLTLFCTVLISSCSGDDECTADAWAGTWSTTADCAGTSLDLSLHITVVDENTIRVEYDGESDEIDVNGCNVNLIQELDFLGNSIRLALDMKLNGDIIDLDIEVTALGVTEECQAVMRRS